MEAWKDIPGYEGLYQVSDHGRVRSLGRNCKSRNASTQWKKPRVLTQEITIHGYCRVRLYDAKGIAKHHAVHRLVMGAFYGESDLEVNHKNEIKTDNRIENLEYCSSKYNCNYGTRNNRVGEKNREKRSVPVLRISTGGAVVEYASRKAAQLETGIDAGHIGQTCSGKRKTAGGYVWRNK